VYHVRARTKWEFDGETIRHPGPEEGPARPDVAAGPGETLRGIDKVEKDTLTFCFVEGTDARPTAFASPAGSKVVLLTLTRVKPKD
jgi:hypothetical protein